MKKEVTTVVKEYDPHGNLVKHTETTVIEEVTDYVPWNQPMYPGTGAPYWQVPPVTCDTNG